MCHKHSIRAAQLSANISRLLVLLPQTKENEKHVNDMIGECQRLDEEFVHWSTSLPDSFTWQTITWDSGFRQRNYFQSETFPGRIDIYQDLCVCSLWNMMRSSRAILASKILRCVAWLSHHTDYRTTLEYAISSKVCRQLITDIIASVPYQLGWQLRHKNDCHQTWPRQSGFACGQDEAEKSLAGILLIWPLACILGLDFTTDDQRTWIKGRLHYIGEHLGIRYASVLTQVLTSYSSC